MRSLHDRRLVAIMTLPTYDIVKKQDNNFVWVEAAHDIQSATKRVNELSRHSDAEFVIFNEHTLQVVATFETPISLYVASGQYVTCEALLSMLLDVSGLHC